MTTQEAMRWSGAERRTGTDRRGTEMAWSPERRNGDRRRGGIGTQKPNPLEALLDGVEIPETAPFEPASPASGSLAEQVRPTHEPHDAIPSVAAIAGHPLHPAVVPLPIGAFVGALAADVAYAATGDPFFARSARLLTGAAVVTGAVAGVLGAVDFVGRRSVRSHTAAWVHAGGNAAAMAIGVASLAYRARHASMDDDRSKAIVPAGLALSVAAGALLAITGWLGGELSFRHRIGLMDEEGSS